jgi:ADP-heptose:LPS heptosyltransferase
MSPKASKMAIPIILCAIRRRRNHQDIRFSADSAQKVLLVKQAERLGNIILMNSAISALGTKYPNLKIDLMLPAPFAEIMTANSHINAIIPVLKKEYITSPWKLAGLVNSIRRNKYDLAIDCSDVNSHSSSGAAYTLLSGAKVVAGWKMVNRRIFDIEVERYSEIIHATQMYEKLFSGVFGVKLEGQPYFDKNISTDKADIIGINCGGRGPKRWPLGKFIEVGKIISTQGYKVNFILGPEENNLRISLQENLPNGCNLLPLMPLPALMKTMSSYRAFISSDTGPMHLAWCLGLPTIAIFIDSELDKFKPLSPGSVTIDIRSGIGPKEIAELAVQAANSRKVSV